MSRTIHRTADGRRFLVTHGDEFDMIVQYHTWLSHLGSAAYRYLITANRLVNAVRHRLGKPYWSLSGAIKRRVKKAVKFMSNFENLVVQQAKQSGVDGVICGHIHQPAMKELDGLLYCNTGDWVESCTALVEHQDGKVELIYWREELERRALIAAERAPVSRANGRPRVPVRVSRPQPALAGSTVRGQSRWNVFAQRAGSPATPPTS
jgi:UDP-2,3-diacylglucosamine pyrophosphatase LpxH